ncbi:MAG: hypothetical protein ABW298_13175 [Candidatus Binatia bacterium]
MDLVREFLERTVAAAGGVVDGGDTALDVLLPETGVRRLGLPEEARIRLSGERGEGEIDGRLGSALIETLVRARLGSPPLGAVALPAELPRALPHDLPVLLNAVRTGDPGETREPARYLACEVRVALHGEEIRSALERVTVRLADGARVAPFRLSAAYPVDSPPLDEEERRRAAGAIRAWTRDVGPKVLAGPLGTLRRRAVRDLERLAEYFASLDRDMAAAVERARSEEERARRRVKRESLAADLAERRAQVRERMRARLSASLVAGLLVETEVARFEVPVRRRVRDGRVTVLARAADRVFEGPRCAACGAETLRFHLCDERLHVLCEECGQHGRLDPTRCRACSSARRPELTVVVPDPTTGLRLG